MAKVLKKIVKEWRQKLYRCCRVDFEPTAVQLLFEDRDGGFKD